MKRVCEAKGIGQLFVNYKYISCPRIGREERFNYELNYRLRINFYKRFWEEIFGGWEEVASAGERDENLHLKTGDKGIDALICHFICIHYAHDMCTRIHSSLKTMIAVFDNETFRRGGLKPFHSEKIHFR